NNCECLGGVRPAKRSLTVPDAENVILALPDEIRRSKESRCDHRLHGLLLVVQGMTAPEVGRLLGDSPRMVQHWVHRFDEEGPFGLAEGDCPGRPPRLTRAQMRAVDVAVRRRPDEVGLSGTRWDGKTLSAFFEQKFEVGLGVRQCQRLFR
ncbi:Transposase-like protein, partial [mine drainage metagenome]